MRLGAGESTTDLAWDGQAGIFELSDLLAETERFSPHPRSTTKLFMLNTAFFDEANTHGPSPTIIMACFLANAREWVLFSRRLRGLQRRYGFKMFHATDFTNKKGEFKRWDDAKCLKLVEELTELVRDNLTEGITVHLERDRYEEEYRKPPIPAKMNLDSQYGVCFRACMHQIYGVVHKDGKKDRLDIVIEDGHKNAGDCGRIFDDLKRRLKSRCGIDLLGTFKRGKKASTPALMLSDFLAYSYSLMRESKAAGGLDYAASTPAPPKKHAGLTFLELLPDALEQLKRDFEQDRQETADVWRARRGARLAASS